jgi:hypothetical protein
MSTVEDEAVVLRGPRAGTGVVLRGAVRAPQQRRRNNKPYPLAVTEKPLMH